MKTFNVFERFVGPQAKRFVGTVTAKSEGHALQVWYRQQGSAWVRANVHRMHVALSA